jgi:hypothetical protein
MSRYPLNYSLGQTYFNFPITHRKALSSFFLFIIVLPSFNNSISYAITRPSVLLRFVYIQICKLEVGALFIVQNDAKQS